MTSRANITANIAAVQRFWQGFNTHNLNLWDEVCAEDFINHDPGLPTPEANLVTIKQTITQLLFGAFPDLQAIEQDLLVDGDKVVTRRILRGTHQGAFMGIAPTGKRVTAGGVWLSHLNAGKIKEQWVYFDALGLLHQISAIPI
jgi:ketosteroid isomerase-like protein